jgi:hypothetical protein
MINPYIDYTPDIKGVATLPDADFYLGKVADLDSQIEEIQESADVQTLRIREWKESRVYAIEKKKEFYIQILRGFIHSTRRKTMNLVNGTLSLRKQQDEIVIEDPDAVLKDGRFTREKVTVSVDKTAIRKHLVATGEIPDGVAVMQQDVKFGYKVNR